MVHRVRHPQCIVDLVERKQMIGKRWLRPGERVEHVELEGAARAEHVAAVFVNSVTTDVARESSATGDRVARTFKVVDHFSVVVEVCIVG